MKEVTLPSGRVLKITLAPFKDGRALYQAFLEEARGISISAETDLEEDVGFVKDVLCTALSSKKIESAIWKCMERSIIDGVKVSEASFEAAEHRDDYFTVMLEVSKENVIPFMKSLYAEFLPALKRLKERQK